MMDILAIVAAIGSLLAGLSGFGYYQWQVAKRQLLLQVMAHCHERYSALYPTLADLPKASSYDELTSDAKRAISAYINLCSEQYYWWRTRKIIPNDVWHVWDVAISDKFSHPTIRLAWDTNHSHDTYYSGFAEYVRAKGSKFGQSRWAD